MTVFSRKIGVDIRQTAKLEQIFYNLKQNFFFRSSHRKCSVRPASLFKKETSTDVFL